jgi:hypothetical protein
LIKTGGTFAGFFLLAALLSIFSIVLPYIIRYIAIGYTVLVANYKLFKIINTYRLFRDNDLKSSLDFALFYQFVCLAGSFVLFATFIVNIASLGRKATPSQLTFDWASSAEHCVHEPAPKLH